MVFTQQKKKKTRNELASVIKLVSYKDVQMTTGNERLSSDGTQATRTLSPVWATSQKDARLTRQHDR